MYKFILILNEILQCDLSRSKAEKKFRYVNIQFGNQFSTNEIDSTCVPMRHLLYILIQITCSITKKPSVPKQRRQQLSAMVHFLTKCGLVYNSKMIHIYVACRSGKTTVEKHSQFSINITANITPKTMNSVLEWGQCVYLFCNSIFTVMFSNKRPLWHWKVRSDTLKQRQNFHGCQQIAK